jgi:D-glycero-D-manno-heptose 1,7-bisphosphate phosphatase
MKSCVRRAVFIDRDGVICRNRKDYVKSWDEFEFLPGAIKALRWLARTDLRVIVVTNQSAINRQLVPAATVEAIHAQMVHQVTVGGGRIDRVLYCPHRPDEHCTCRKPQPGMLLKAAEEMGIDLDRSFLIGDAESDIQAGRAAGCARRYLVLTGRGRRQYLRCLIHGERDFRPVLNLQAAVQAISGEACKAHGLRTLPIG